MLISVDCTQLSRIQYISSNLFDDCSVLISFNQSFIHDLGRSFVNLLLQYGDIVHGASPAQVFQSRKLRCNLRRQESADVIHRRKNDLLTASGITLGPIGNRMLGILDMGDGSARGRCINQINHHMLDTTGNEPVLRSSERLTSRLSRDHEHSRISSNCGGHDDCSKISYKFFC